MIMDCLNRTDEYIVLIEKMRLLLDEASVSNFTSHATCVGYRQGVKKCISILEEEYENLI